MTAVPRLDAVETACCAVEADPSVDSVGLGGLPDSSGRVTVDGAVMTAPNRCGSVCALAQHIHPVSIARHVMEHTQHIMLAGSYADEFAQHEGFEPTQNILTPSAREAWEKWRDDPAKLTDERYRGWVPPRNVEELRGVDDHPAEDGPNRYHDTIGVLALDNYGSLAVACSTSGMAFKMPGRVGDSPIIGHGLYADPGVGAAVTTGTGELIMGVCGSFLAVELMRAGRGCSPQEAAEDVIRRIGHAFTIHADHQAAVLVMSPTGQWGAAALRPGYRTAVMHAQGNPELIPSAFVLIPDESAQSDNTGL
ncbi:MAG: N(4)-(beta-N-acetylglucosaminyl)-L-asparaginase [Planctomycetes bacterium]|nr:N(4)-(beta-N-acetylglucosaminyl)-L-asparaginase [Planctomycetota bacterium]